MEPGQLIPPGIWTLADVIEYGREKGVCPYFAVRRMVTSFYVQQVCNCHLRLTVRCRSWMLSSIPSTICSIPKWPTECRTNYRKMLSLYLTKHTTSVCFFSKTCTSLNGFCR